MKTFEIIESSVGIEAILLPSEVSPAQCNVLYKLLHPSARLDAGLSKRWSLWGVMCSPAWSSEQLHRSPMLRPRGLILAFVDER
jgi:hypothetical protein